MKKEYIVFEQMTPETLTTPQVVANMSVTL